MHNQTDYYERSRAIFRALHCEICLLIQSFRLNHTQLQLNSSAGDLAPQIDIQ
jgi:hypothetical protein